MSKPSYSTFLQAEKNYSTLLSNANNGGGVQTGMNGKQNSKQSLDAEKAIVDGMREKRRA